MHEKGAARLITWLSFWMSWIDRCKISVLFWPAIAPMSIMRSSELLAASDRIVISDTCVALRLRKLTAGHVHGYV